MWKKTYANSESHQRTIADKAPDGIRFSPFPKVLEFNDVSSSLPLFSVLESMKRSRNPSTAVASDEKKLELI